MLRNYVGTYDMQFNSPQSSGNYSVRLLVKKDNIL